MTRTRKTDGEAELAAQAAAQAKVWDLLAELSTQQNIVRATSRITRPAERERAIAKRDALLEQLIEARRELNAAHEASIQASQRGDGAFDARVAERAALLERVRRTLPSLRTDGMSERALHEAAIKHLCGADLSQRSDGYVRGYFERLMARRIDSAQPEANPRPQPQAQARTYQPAWRAPLSYSAYRIDGDGPVVVRDENAGLAWRAPLRYSAYRIDGDGPVVVRDEAAGSGGGTYRAPWRSPLRLSSSTTSRVRVRE